ncbi:hypothetical protein V8E53_006255 [Lactarius tabidus]
MTLPYRVLPVIRSRAYNRLYSFYSFEFTGYRPSRNHKETQMVPFAGYRMPLVYEDSAGLFDVGHMVQSHFRSATATNFNSLEWFTLSSLSTLEPHTSTLSVLLNEQAGIIDDIIDDMMITKHASDARTEDLAACGLHLLE